MPPSKNYIRIWNISRRWTKTLAMNAPDAKLYTLDLPVNFKDGDVATLTRGDKEWTRMARDSVGVAFHGTPYADRIHQLRANALEVDVTSVIASADLCFIDGGHSYECVQADTKNAFKLISSGGVIIWDDYTWFMDGVHKYITELSKTHSLRRIAGSQYVVYRKD